MSTARFGSRTTSRVVDRAFTGPDNQDPTPANRVKPELACGNQTRAVVSGEGREGLEWLLIRSVTIEIEQTYEVEFYAIVFVEMFVGGPLAPGTLPPCGGYGLATAGFWPVDISGKLVASGRAGN